jgi:MFS family permease
MGAVLGLAAAVGLGLAWSRGVLTALTWDDAPRIAAVIIFLATYVVIAIGKLPRFQLDRAVLADLMRGTGRYNVAQGAVATVQGVGASVSGLVAGEIVDHFGYSAAFVTLGMAALAAPAAFFFGMSETARRYDGPTPIPATRKEAASQVRRAAG